MTDLDLSREVANLAKLTAEAAKLTAEQTKLRLESRKLTREIFWHPVGVAAALMGAGAALFAALGGLALAFLRYTGKA